tara:strand:- start:42 stop:347 length:306 start_codon:yes stop_codon:yes gene_type:complete
MIGPNPYDMGASEEQPEEQPKFFTQVKSLEDLPDKDKKRLAQFTDTVSEMLLERFKSKANPNIKGKELYLACVVEMIAYLLMTQQAQNFLLVQLAERLREE